MTEFLRGRQVILDLVMKAGALGVALLMSYLLNDFIAKQREDYKELMAANAALQSTLIGIVREQNGGLVSQAAATREQTSVLEDLRRTQDGTNRLIETLLIERRTGTTRPASFALSPE